MRTKIWGKRTYKNIPIITVQEIFQNVFTDFHRGPNEEIFGSNKKKLNMYEKKDCFYLVLHLIRNNYVGQSTPMNGRLQMSKGGITIKNI